MRKLLFVIILFGLGGGYLMYSGYDVDSIVNMPKKVELKAQCFGLTKMFLTSTVNLTVDNSFNRTHRNVSARITAYDKRGNVIKRKNTQFLRALNPYSSLTKIVTLPAKTSRCKCIVVDSSPE